MRAFLIDFENVKSAGLVGIETLGIDDQVVILYSVNSNTISFEMHQKIMSCAANVEYYQIRRGGKNSLDFQLSSLLGYLLASGLYSHLYIISNDSGFDALYDFWTSQYIPTDVVVYRRPNIAMAVAHSAFHARLQEDTGVETLETDVTVDDSSSYPDFALVEEEAPIAVKAEELPPSETEPEEPEADPAETAAVLAAIQAAQLEEEEAAEISLQPEELPLRTEQEDDLSAAGRMKQAELEEEETAGLPLLFTVVEEPVSSAKELSEEEARSRRRRGRPRRNKTEKEPAAVVEVSKADPAAVAALSAKLEDELTDICSREQRSAVAEEILLAEGKQEFYRAIIRRFGQKKGLVVYKAVKSDFSAFKKK